VGVLRGFDSVDGGSVDNSVIPGGFKNFFKKFSLLIFCLRWWPGWVYINDCLTGGYEYSGVFIGSDCGPGMRQDLRVEEVPGIGGWDGSWCRKCGSPAHDEWGILYEKAASGWRKRL
jgi:hypothetical protein